MARSPRSLRLRSTWLALSAVLVALGAGAEVATEEPDAGSLPEDVQERGVNILGCPVGPDLNRLSRCVNGKVNSRVQSVQRQLDAARRETSKVRGDLTRRMNVVEQAKRTLEGQVRAANQAKSRVEGQLRSANQAKQALDGQLRTLNQAKSRLDGQLKTAQRSAAQAAERARQQLRTAEQGLARARSEAQRLQTALTQETRRRSEEAAKVAANAAYTATLAGERQMLESVRALQLEPLFQCLADGSGGGADLTRMVQDAAQDPARFTRTLFEQSLAALEGDFGTLMAEPLATLGPGASRNASRATSDDGAGTATRQAIASFEQAASALPAGRCLMQATKPQLDALAGTSASLAGQVRASAQRLFDEQILPIVTESIASGVGDRFAEIASPTRTRSIGDYVKTMGGDALGRIEGVANAVVARHIAVTMNAGADRLDGLARAVNGGGDTGSAVAGLRSALDPEAQWSEELYLELGLELFRAAAHTYIEADFPGHGGDLINKGIGVLHTAWGVVGEVACGVAGLVPEVGAGICEVVVAGVDGWWSAYIAPLLPSVAKLAVKTTFNLFWDQAKQVARDELQKANLRANAGPFLALVDMIPTRQAAVFVAQSAVSELRDASLAYNASVLRLAETAARN